MVVACGVGLFLYGFAGKDMYGLPGWLDPFRGEMLLGLVLIAVALLWRSN